jgi:hypothetical protein
MIQDTSLSMSGLDGWGLIPGKARDFSLLHSVQTGLIPHPKSILGTFPRVKQPGHETDLSLPPSVKVKNGGTISPLPHMSLWHLLN